MSIKWADDPKNEDNWPDALKEGFEDIEWMDGPKEQHEVQKQEQE